VNKAFTTERRLMAPHPGEVDQSLRFTLSDLDGRYYWLDGVLYANTDHPCAAELSAAQPSMPAINQAAFDRLQELTRQTADSDQRSENMLMLTSGATLRGSQTLQHR
jgi:hypothetical protein